MNDDYYKILKEDIDNVISYSVTFKQVVERLKKLDYQVYSRNGIITIYMNGKDKVRIEKAFGNDYSIDSINKQLYSSRQIVLNPYHKELFLKNILEPINIIKVSMAYIYIIVIY